MCQRSVYLALACLFSIGALAAPQRARGAAGPDCESAPGAAVLRVRAAARGRGDGARWADAFPDLESALAAARARPGAEQLWLAEGRYEPAGPGGFSLPSDVALLGGFSGWEERLEQRDAGHRRSVLSGAGRAWHVLFAAGVRGVRIDGVEVEGGAALGDLASDAEAESNAVRGGGLLAYDSEVALCGALFRDNRARKFGGAVFARGGQLRVVGSRFADNSALRGPDEVHDSGAEADTDGGAIAVHDARELRIERSRFDGNVAGDDGGALALRRTDVHIAGSEFSRNRGIGAILPLVLPVATDDFVTSTGGAICIENEYLGQNAGDQSHAAAIEDSRFTENEAAAAGAVYVLAAPGSATRLERVEFIRNGGSGRPDPAAPPREQGISFGRGGGALLVIGLRGGDRELDGAGAYRRPRHSVQLRRALFLQNRAGSGGALALIGVDARLERSAFLDNLARQRGGAIWHQNLLPLLDQLAGLEPDLGTVQIDRSLFLRNRALGTAEALQVLTFPVIANRVEQTFGGGAILNDESSHLEITRSRFAQNLARGGDGGAIHNGSASFSRFAVLAPWAPTSYGSQLTVRDSAFDENEVEGSGSGGAIANGGSAANGAVVAESGADVRAQVTGSRALVERCSFEGGRAADSGGALANWAGSQFAVEQSLFSANEADAGGAIASSGHPENPASLAVSQSEFRHNRARAGAGGALLLRDTQAELQHNAFRGNAPDALARAAAAQP